MKGEDCFRESLKKQLEYQRELMNQQELMLETLKVALQLDVKFSSNQESAHNSYDVRPSNRPQNLGPHYHGAMNPQRDVTMFDAAVSTKLTKPISVYLKKPRL